jgi:hypothetical protein
LESISVPGSTREKSSCAAMTWLAWPCT